MGKEFGAKKNVVPRRQSFSVRSELDSRALFRRNPNRKGTSPIKAEKSIIPKDHIFFKIQRFYRGHLQGPNRLVDLLIQKYQLLYFQDTSLKRSYEELNNMVK